MTTEASGLRPETFSELKADYLKDGLMPPERLFRRDGGGKRYYLRPLDTKGTSYKLAIGVTSAIPYIIAINDDWLTKWKLDVGLDRATAIADKAACFGTMIHTLVGYYCKIGEFDFTILNDYVRDNIPVRFAETDLQPWQDRARKSVAAIAQFFSDYDVVPEFCEYPVFNADLGLAHYLDFKGELTWKKERKKANVDWKIIKASVFGEPYQAQAAFARRLWNIHCDNRNMAGEKTDITLLMTPKDYRKLSEPTYAVMDCTDNQYDQAFDLYMQVWKSQKETVLKELPSQEIYAHGNFKIGKGFTFEANRHYSIINYEFL